MIDYKLIEECRGGDLTNFGKVIEAASPFAYSVAFRMLGDEELAKDMVQETMVTVWQKLKDIRSSVVFKTWLYRIVINKCYDELRRQKRNQEFSQDEKTWNLLSDKVAYWPASDLENREIAEIIHLLTKQLSPKQKTVFVLSDLEEMTGEEITGITGMNRLAVKANLYYARKNISTMLEKYLRL